MACDPKIRNRVKRAEGQLRGILKMMEEEQDCQAVVTQLAAVRSSIDKVMSLVLTENLMQQVAAQTGEDVSEEAQVAKAIDLLIKHQS